MKLLIAVMTMMATSAFAQTAACDGNITMVRVSAIKAGGTMKNFVAAVDAQRAWYRANGVTDNQLFVARVIPRGETDYSETDVLSYHVNPPSPDRIPNRGDAAWKAFVKLFQDNSEIKSEFMTCMPKPSK